MAYSVEEAVQILSRTPKVLRELLVGLDDKWLNHRNYDDALTPSELVGHLIPGEYTDRISRMKIILSDIGTKTFQPFNKERFDKSLSLEQRFA